MIRKIKYNLFNEDLVEESNKNLEQNTNCNIPTNQIFQNIDVDSHSTTNLDYGDCSSESSMVQCKENVTCHNKKSIEKISHLNLMKNKLIDNNKQKETQNENEQTVRVLKSVLVNSESFPVSVKQQSNEDGELIQVNTKKSKLPEKYISPYRNEDLHTFDTAFNNMNTLDCNAENTTHYTHKAESSYISTKGLKRTIPTFNLKETNKKFLKSKSRHEKNVINCNQNQNINSGFLNPEYENTGGVTLDNDNPLLDHSKNHQDINEISHITIDVPIRENKWVTKASHSELSVVSALNLKRIQSNFSDRNKDENIDNCSSKVIELNSDQDDIASPLSDIRWSLKSPCDTGSPESKPTGNNSDQMEIEITSSDTEGNNSPKTEHLLSLRNSEEIISKLVSSRRSINENENTQVYALPMDQKLSHVEHPYVENAINSSTRDLEVVNVLSPVSINSTDISMNKSSWIPDISLVHAQNDHNDIDGDHSQSSTQQLNSLCNSINTSRVSNHNSEVEHSNHMQLETAVMSRSCSYNRIEPRIFTDDSYTAALSPNENSGYSSAYDVNRIPLTVSVKSIPITVSSTDAVHKLNDSSNNTYHVGNTINLSFNGLKKNTIDPQSSYSFTVNKRPMDTAKNVSPSNKDKNDILDIVSDEFSDVDSMDLRINSTESKETNTCLNDFSMSSLISTDLKSINTLNSFDKSLSNWSTIKNPSETSNHHQKQNLKIYTDPSELISGPVNLNTQSVGLNETRVPKMFLGNKSPSQVYYSPMADLCVPSDMDIVNHMNVEDSKQNNLKNRPYTRDRVNTCSNDKYIHSVLQPTTDNDISVKQSLISGYDGVLNQNSPIANNGLIYKFPRSDSNSSVRYETPIQLQHKNPDCLSPHNGLSYSGFEQIIGPNLIENPNQKEEQNMINMTQLMLQASKNCKVHYKWPLNKNKSQTTPNGKVQETSQNVDYKRNSTNPVYTFIDEELNQTRLQNISPNEISSQNTSLPFNERNNDSTSYQSSQQFQDISNLIASDLSPTIQSGSESVDEKKQTQLRVVNNSFENNSRKEPIDQQETMYRNTKMSNQSQETSTTLSREVFEAARYLFNKGKLFLCMYPKCINSHHFRVIPSNAEMLRHEFTVPFDDFRFNIQYKYKQLLTSNPRTWPSVPELVQLTKRCLCEICGDFDSKLNQNQEMLHTYVEGKKPNIEEDNNENEQPTNPKIRLSWKKNLAKRFSSEAIAKQSISQMIEDMESHINRFARAFTIIFALSKDVKKNTQNLQNTCESYSDINDSDISLNSECVLKLDIAHTHFVKDLHVHSYQYLQLPKVIPKYVLEELSNSSYHPPNQNVLNTSHQFDEEHLPNEINRYFVGSSPSPSYQSVNPNLTSSQSLKYVHENIPNTSHQPTAENSPSTSRQPSVGNISSSPHQPILNNFPTTSHGMSLDSCSLNDRSQKHNHMSRYYSDGQIYTEFSHTYLQVPSAQFPNSSANSYYSSPVNMPSDNSVPFCSPSLSVNSVPNSPSSDCSIPSLVETVATAVPEHALLDDSLEAVNAAHNLMLISNRHRYNSTTSIATTTTTDTIIVTTTATTNAITVTSTISTNETKTNNISTAETTIKNISPINTTINNTSPSNTTGNTSIIEATSDTVQPSITEPEDQETDLVHNSRRKKKKKHDKKKDKKKKGKR